MKTSKIISLSLITLFFMTGCSSLNLKIPYSKIHKKDEEKKEQVITSLPTDREQIHTTRTEKTYSAKDLEEGVVTGDWIIEQVNGNPAIGESTPFLKLVPSEKRLYGNNGCNTINASYIYNQEEKQLSFNDIASTMRLCNLEGITDTEIGLALGATRTYSWDHQGDEYFLYFYNAVGECVMKLMHQNFDFLNGTWHVVSIENETIDDPEMNIVIDIDEGKIHGNTGCNILNGRVDIDMETVNTINFRDIMTTRMACPNMENQTRLIVALEDAAHAKPVDSDTVILLNLLKQPVLTLRRVK
ncbi:MAG: META domain-containing protein [Muribaculaceae bacterium]|nr:META domain-containing protein [Muribaculaceae bacterium]